MDDGMYAGIPSEAFLGEPTYLGQVTDRLEGGIMVEDADVEAKIVLQDLIGFARPAYTLDGCCRIVPTPELIKTVGIGTKGTGQRNVKGLEESKITGAIPTPVKLDCHPNEYHIVITDKMARSGAWDMLGQYVKDAAGEIAHMRNQDIATELLTATQVTGENWSTFANGVNTYNPMTKIGTVINTLAALGYPPTFMAVNGSDWSNYITNTRIAASAQAGLINVGGSVTLAGWPSVKVLLDYGITATYAIIGSNEGIILADGGTEAVKYRNDLKRYTGYLVRQWLYAKIVTADAVRELTSIA